MNRAVIALALLGSVVMARVAGAQGSKPLSLAIETGSLAYGLAASSPRISLSAAVPLSGVWSLEASPAVSWGGEAGSSSFELELPVLLRAEGRLGAAAPYAAAGLMLGAGAMGGGGLNAFAAGPLLELGARLPLFRSPVFLELYAGLAGTVRVATGSWGFGASGFGGLRLGWSFSPTE